MPTNSSLWRLSLSYFFNFAAIGGVSIFLPLYLEKQAFGAEMIGQLMAIFGLTKIGIPNFIGWVTDRNSNHLIVIRSFAVLLIIAFAGFFIAQTAFEFAMVIFIYSTLWSCLLPQYESTTVRHLKGRLHRYAHIRIWGSIGFVLTSLALGEWVERQGISIFLPVAFALTIATAGCSFLLPKTVQEESGLEVAFKTSLWKILKKKEVSAFFLIMFLIFISFAPYGTFFSIYLEKNHYAHNTIGLLWAVSVAAEMGIFLLAPRWVKKWGVRPLLLSSLLLTAIRWLMIGYGISHFSIVLFAQLLHAASFGLLHIAAIQLVAEFFKGKYQAQGQAALACVGFGIGNTIGSVASGFTWANWGEANTFLWASVVAFIAFIIAWLLVVPKKATLPNLEPSTV
ncbi:MAG: MFS transporter [Gammaproteobacteria bacterium]|nr:MFS transporter [Gammaproteobacteria bacterium]